MPTRHNDESAELNAIITKVQRAIVAAQTSDSLPIQKVELTLKNLDQKVVGVGLEGAILAFKAAIEGKHSEQSTQTVTISMTPPHKPKGAMLAAPPIAEADITELLRTINAVRAGLQSAHENPLGFTLSTATASIDFVVKNDGTVSIVWEGEYDHEQTNTLTLTLGTS
jgi:hypothetical protein